jgi:hypothetical protein
MSPRRPGPATDHEAATSPAETGATITATRDDGPLEGESIEAEVVEGRPPKIIDVQVDHGSTCRHCLADWLQTGSSAVYAFEIGRIERASAPRQGADHRVAVRRSSSASSPLSWPTRSAAAATRSPRSRQRSPPRTASSSNCAASSPSASRAAPHRLLDR